jgi:hypothetical protein
VKKEIFRVFVEGRHHIYKTIVRDTVEEANFEGMIRKRDGLVNKTKALKNSNRKASEAERINRFDRSQFNSTEMIGGGARGGNKGWISEAFPYYREIRRRRKEFINKGIRRGRGRK